MAEGQEQHHLPDMVPWEEYNALRQENEELRALLQVRGNQNGAPPPASQPYDFPEHHPINAGAGAGHANPPQQRAHFLGTPPGQPPVLPILPAIPE